MLSNLDEIEVCTEYVVGGNTTQRFPSDIRTLETVRPVYLTLPGWKEDITGITRLDDLPSNAREYVTFISDFLDVPARLISSGPKREQTILV